MFIKKIKLLSAFDFIKVSIPVIALLSVFFLKSMLVSYIQNKYQDKLKTSEASQGIDIAGSDKDFITALLSKNGLNTIKQFQLGDFGRNPFISGFYNKTKPAPAEKREKNVFVPAPQLMLPPTYNVSVVFNGKFRKYAVIDNNIVALGETMINGDRVAAVRDGRVLISGIWGKQWFYVTY